MISLRNVNVQLSYKHVLNDVSLDFEDGKIYSILGENGAGKSTLAKILCGDKKPTSGDIFFNGEKVYFANPRMAIQKGICCVHQRPLLAESISIRENLLLGTRKLDVKQLNYYMDLILPGRKISTLVKNLTPAEHLFVSMIGALLKNPSVLILDEPSALLSLAERAFLFEKLHVFANNGMTIIVISHFISETLEQSDRVILLKSGKILMNEEASDVDEDTIKKVLFDVEEKEELDDNAWPPELNVKFVHNVTDDQMLRRYTTDGRTIGIIPADRTFRGSDPKLTVLQLLTALRTHLSKADSIVFAKDLLRKADVNITLNEKVANLSGGMLQRLILQREIAENPDVLLLCEPRQGLDASAVQYLFEVVDKLIKEGVMVVVQEAVS